MVARRAGANGPTVVPGGAGRESCGLCDVPRRAAPQPGRAQPRVVADLERSDRGRGARPMPRSTRGRRRRSSSWSPPSPASRVTIGIWRRSRLGAAVARTRALCMAACLAALVLWLVFREAFWAHMLVVAAVPVSFWPTWAQRVRRTAPASARRRGGCGRSATSRRCWSRARSGASRESANTPICSSNCCATPASGS